MDVAPAGAGCGAGPSGVAQGRQELVDQFAVAGLGEAGAGGVRVQPEDPVHLVVGGEVAVGRLGRPVTHLLGPAVDEVVGGGQPGAGRAAVAGLLLDLAQGAGEGVLVALQLSLGMRPVVMAPLEDSSCGGFRELSAAGEGRR